VTRSALSNQPGADRLIDLTWMILPPVMCVAIAASLHASGGLFGDYGQRILLDLSIAMIAAVSLTIVNGFTGQFSIGHAAFMAIGGYTAAWISYYFALSFWGTAQVTPTMFGPHQWLMLGSAMVGGFVAAGIGWVVGLPSLRLKGDYLAIVTLGFGEIVRVLLQQTNKQKHTADELAAAPAIGFGHAKDQQGFLFPPAVGGSEGFAGLVWSTNLFIAYLLVLATLVFAYRLKQSSYGRAMLSIREDEIAAESMGINVTKLKVRAFMLGAFFAGIAGAIYAHQPAATLRPVDAGFQRSFDIVMMVVLGGLGSISGATLAAILITLLNVWLVDFGAFRMILFALILILMMIFRPQGLFGLNEVWDLRRLWKKRRPEAVRQT
jgi:branched-chain amino acid transport system permease protein